MATDLEVMVRDLYQAVDAGQDRVRADDVVAGRVMAARPVGDLPRRLRVAAWPVAAVAVVVVLLVGAVTLVMMSGGGADVTDSPSGPATTPTTLTHQATTTAPPATATTVATAPSFHGDDPPSTPEPPLPGTSAIIVEGTDSFVVETAGLGPLRWTRFEIEAGDTPPFVSVDPLGGYIAHGIAGGELGTWSDTVMHSVDGTSWRILSGEEAAAASTRVDASYPQPKTETLPGQVGKPGRGAASQGNFGFFAYGNTSDCCEAPGSQSAAWVSADGRTWERIELPPDIGYDGGFGARGDIIFISSDKHDEQGAHPTVLWIGTFEK